MLSEARQRYRKQAEIASALGISQPIVARKLRKNGIGVPRDAGGQIAREEHCNFE